MKYRSLMFRMCRNQIHYRFPSLSYLKCRCLIRTCPNQIRCRFPNRMFPSQIRCRCCWPERSDSGPFPGPLHKHSDTVHSKLLRQPKSSFSIERVFYGW